MSDKKQHINKKITPPCSGHASESDRNIEEENKKTLKVTQFSMQEIWAAMRGNVHKSKKHYNRNEKHKGKI